MKENLVKLMNREDLSRYEGRFPYSAWVAVTL